MKSIIKSIYFFVLKRIPFFKIIYYTKGTHTPIKLKHILWNKIFGFNRKAHWPTHFTSIVDIPHNVVVGIETCPGYSYGNYINALEKIYIGDYTQIAPNVGLITSNHDVYDTSKYINKEIRIGKYCWVGMNAVVLPGVVLGDCTIVGAGAVVTKSFEEGYCVIGGNPARKIKDLDREKFVFHKSKYEYNGYWSNKKYKRRLK